MLNYFHFKELNGQYLLTNDIGRYVFLNKSELRDLIAGEISPDSELGLRLKEKRFLFEESVLAFTEQNTYLMRDSKNYVFSATSLHIFVVTTACNMSCVYCQANNGVTTPTDFMSREVARRAVDLALKSPARHLSFEFQGGEPLLNFPVIRYIVEYAESQKADREIRYSVVSNLTLLTDEMIAFFKQYRVSVST